MTDGRVTISGQVRGISCCAQFLQQQTYPQVWAVELYLDGQRCQDLTLDAHSTPSWTLAERLFRAQLALRKPQQVEQSSLRLVAAD